MKAKRVWAWILTLSMLLSLVVVPAGAASDNVEVTANVVMLNLQNFNGTVSNSQVTSANKVNAGQVVAVQVVADNPTATSYNLASYVVELNYDTQLFELYSGTYTDTDGEEQEYNGVVWQRAADNGFSAKWNNVSNEVTQGQVYWSGTANVGNGKTNTVALQSGGQRVLGYMLLRAKSDAESVKTAVTFSTPSEEVNYLANIPDGAVKAAMMTNIAYSQGTEITINGVTPSISNVTLDKSTVEVNGTNGATVKATATSAKGTDLTKNVAWTVSSRYGGTGVSISPDGTITVAKNAAADTYTIMAEGKNATAVGSADAKLTVTRQTAQAKTVTISGGVDTITVPAAPFENGDFVEDAVSTYKENEAFTVTVIDQYGETIANPNVVWSFENTSVGTQYRLTSAPYAVQATEGENCEKYTFINTGSAAGLEINQSGNLLLTSATKTGTATVTATVGGVTATKTVNVVKANPVAKKMTMSGADSVTIPTGDTAAKETYSIEVFDQYQEKIANPDAEWSIEPANTTGVSVANGVLTVDKTAQVGTISVRAAVKGNPEVFAFRQVQLQSVVFTENTAPTVQGNPVYGSTWQEIVTSNGSYTAKVGNTVIKGTYSLKDANVRPDAGKQTYTILFNSDNGVYKDVVVFTGEVTVQPYTLTVTNGNIAVAKTYDGTTAVADGNVTGKLGYTNPSFDDELSITYTSAAYNDASVTGANKVTFSGLKVEGAKAANYKLNVDSFEVAAKNSKASLTIKAKDNTITYGNTPHDNGFTVVSGLCGNDTADVVTGVTYTYNYTQNGNVGSYIITPVGGTADNYEVTGYETGTLTVSPKALTADAIAAIDAVTYNGKAQAPALNVVDGTKVLTADTDYTAVYSDNTNAGTAKVVITGKGNYSGTAEQTFTINKKPVTVTSGIAAVNREYNGTTAVELDCTKAVFGGLIDGDNLTVAATGTMKDAHAGSTKEVTISGLTLGGTSAGNYVLAGNGNQTTTTVNISKQAATALTLTAKNAVYTAAAYDAKNVTPSRNANDVHLTYYADDNGKQGAEINAPVNVGTYWVSGKINETEDISAAVAAAVKFQITKAPLTVTANANTITYGDAPAANGYTVSGLLGSDTESVVSDVEYAYSYKQYGNIGAYDITPKDAKAANYEIKFVSGKLTVEPKNITLTSVTLADKTFDNTTAATVTAAAFDGLVNNDSLVLGTDFTATAVYDSVDASTAAAAKATVLLGTTDKAKNYTLTNGNDFVTYGVINKAVTTLTGTAKNAAYTGTAYNAVNLSWNSNLTDPAVDVVYYSDAACTKAAQPINVGKYWAKGVIEESTNHGGAEAVAAFEITRAPLTITVKDSIITYGDKPEANDTTVTGLVGADTPEVITSGRYTFDYKQFDNVGTYTIGLESASAENYDVTIVPGKLTVSPKIVGLEWTGAGKLYYDGKTKNVTAAATGLVNNDEIAVTVSGGTQTAIGSYSAAATGLTGAKAGNYALPEEKTAAYTIEAALTSVTVTPSTITATIDGLTIKLVGYKNTDEKIKVNGTTDDKLTVNGVEYTIDKSGVKDMPTEVEVLDEKSKVEKPDGAEIEDNIVSEINNTATKGEGLNKAVADKIAAADKTITEADKTENEVTKVQVKITLNIQPKSYADGKLTLNIEPKITYIYVKADGTEVRTADAALANSDIKAPVTISVKLPTGFNPNFAKHHSEMIPVKVENGVATWQQSSFSDVTLVSDTRKAVLTFQFEDGHTQTITYTPADIGKTLPTDSKSGYTFNGWSDGTNTYTSLTDAALTALDGTKTLTGSFTQKSNTSGGSGGGGGGAVVSSTYVIMAKAGNGGTISPNGSVSVTSGKDQSFTIKANDGYKIEDVLVDGKSVGAVETYKFTKVTEKHTIEARFAKTEDVAPSVGFTDVKASDYFFNAVDWAVKNDITNGMTSTTFGPDVTCTRAQTVTFLWRAAGSPAPKSANNPFTDVKTSDYFYNAVLWAVENGVTNGASATTFAPDATVERGQVVTFLWRAAGRPAAQADSHFTDLQDGAYYTDAVLWAVEKNITTGTSATTFAPKAGCTRGQIVTFLFRAA